MVRVLRPCILGIFITAVSTHIGCSDDEPQSTTSSPVTSASSSGTGGAGMASSTTGTAGSGQGGTMAECMVPDDCPDPGSVCFVRTCIDQTCGKVVQNGFEVNPMAVGDCKHSMCDPNGNIVVAADTSDAYDDGNGCTADTCNDQTPENNPVSEGYLCAAGLCGTLSTGIACRECLVNAHCAGNPAKPLCRQGTCVASSCGNGMKDSNEPAVDCGKNCILCDDNSPCNDFQDCISGLCSGAPMVCQPATCMDGLPNGKETGEDCGGPDCTKCIAGFTCMLPSDCETGVCLPSTCDGGICPNKCQPSSCTDGVMNQDETAVDCGGTTCSACP